MLDDDGGVLDDDGGQDQLWSGFAFWGAGAGPATGKTRTGAGIGMLRWLKAQFNSVSGRQVSRFLLRNLVSLIWVCSWVCSKEFRPLGKNRGASTDASTPTPTAQSWFARSKRLYTWWVSVPAA